MFDLDIRSLAAELLNMSKERGFTVATVESCTGGLVCGALTTVAGSSSMVQGGLITYANEAKAALAGVPVEMTSPGCRLMNWLRYDTRCATP